MANQVKVSGGMDKEWISQIRSSPEVQKIVIDTGSSIKRDIESETDSSARAWTNHGFKYFFGSAIQKGKWGATYIIWPMNPIARDDDGGFRARMRSTMRAAGLKLRPRGK